LKKLRLSGKKLLLGRGTRTDGVVSLTGGLMILTGSWLTLSRSWLLLSGSELTLGGMVYPANVLEIPDAYSW
jgi:hypothetical protein